MDEQTSNILKVSGNCVSSMIITLNYHTFHTIDTAVCFVGIAGDKDNFIDILLNDSFNDTFIKFFILDFVLYWRGLVLIFVLMNSKN